MEFEWKIFPGFTTAGIVNEIRKKMMGELQCDPADFKDRTIFMSTFNNIVWDARGNDELCENNSKNVCSVRTTISSRSLVFPGAWIRKEVVRNLYTHSVSHAHFSDTFSLRGVQTSRTRGAQRCLQCACQTSPSRPLHFLTFHPPSLLFPHGHSDTSFPSALPCRTVPDPKARVQRTSARAARSLATWLIPRTPQIMNPKSSTRLLLQTETRRP